jgi:hypothetical protein
MPQEKASACNLRIAQSCATCKHSIGGKTCVVGCEPVVRPRLKVLCAWRVKYILDISKVDSEVDYLVERFVIKEHEKQLAADDITNSIRYRESLRERAESGCTMAISKFNVCDLWELANAQRIAYGTRMIKESDE